MKITPISNGTGSPAGADIGQQRTSSDRIAAAKAVASGQKPNINLVPSDTPVDPAIEHAARSIRRIKMRTQVSPDRFDPNAALQETFSQPEAAPESSIPDATEQTPEGSEETKPLSPQFAALARQRRALQVKEREIAEREAKLTPPNMSEYVSKADLIANPLKVFESGVTYDQLTEAILGQGGVSPEVQELKRELKALKEGVDKNLSDRDSQAKQAALSEMKREADQLVAQGDDFELVRGKGYVPKAIDLIDKTYETTGEILDVSKALQLVEEELLKDAIKDAQFKKVQGRLSTQNEQPLQPQQQNQPMRTLTNRDGARPVMDRRQRAIARFHGQQIK